VLFFEGKKIWKKEIEKEKKKMEVV